MNSKIYNIYLKHAKNFSIVINNFRFRAGFNIFIRKLFIRFITQITLLINFVINNKISLKISSVINLIMGLVTSIAKISPKLNIISSVLIGFILNISIKNPLNLISSAMQFIVTAIHTDKIKINASPLLGQFYTIGHWDANTLGSIDSDTLGFLDFVAT